MWLFALCRKQLQTMRLTNLVGSLINVLLDSVLGQFSVSSVNEWNALATG